MLLACLVAAAAAQDFKPPNSTLGVGVGMPTLLSLQGEAWFAHQASFVLGVGLPRDLALNEPTFNWALRWRPEFACVACDERLSATFGVGLGGLIDPVFPRAPWGFAVGPDLAGTGVYWFTPNLGIQATAHVGLGPGWAGTNLSEGNLSGWAFLSAGLAF